LSRLPQARVCGRGVMFSDGQAAAPT